jgi:CheY-like chemotaxis protein
MVRICNCAGHDCVTAEEPSQALDHIKNEAFGLIITDIEMPGMNGIEFIRQVRDMGLTAIPVIFMSGNPNNFEKFVDEMTILGGVFMSKPPLSPTALISLINDMTGQEPI